MKKIIHLAFLLFCFSFKTMAIWTQTNGPTGGYVNCLLTSGTNIFAGTPNGVFISTNAGASWTLKNTGLNTGLDNTEVYAMAQIGSTVFLGTNEGVYSTVNNGNSWLDANGGIGNALPFASDVFAMLVNGSDLFVGLNSGGIYKTSNNGSTWTAINTGFPINRKVNSIVVMGSNLFAATEGAGIYFSTNNGTSWSAVLDPSLATSSIRALLVNGTTLFAAEYGTSGLLVSSNNGASFTVNTTGFSSGTAVRSFALSGSTIFAGTVNNGIFKSTNNGTTWTASTTGLVSSTICGIYALTLVGTDLFAASQGCGIYKSTNNGSSWIESNNSLTNSVVQALAFNGTSLFAGIAGVGIYKSDDEGTTWTNSSVGTSIYNIKTIKTYGSAIFAGGDGGAYRSLNNGATWTDISSSFVNFPFTTVYGFASDATYLYAATGDGVYISANSGSTWTLSNSGLVSTEIYDITVSGTSIYVGTDDGLYKSINNGSTWSLVYSSLLGISRIIINGTYIYALPIYGLAPLLSTNNGVSFNPISVGLPSILNSVNSLASVSTNTFLGTSEGVYRTSNATNNWINFSSGFAASTNINSMTTNATSIFAGTDFGVWKNTLELSTQICIVTVDSLSQNNVIIWEKPLVTTIDSFRIYREDVSNVYIHIASVGYNQLSQYIDVSAAGNPNLASRRYKIREVNTGGVLGNFSAYHNTILLQENGGNFNWNIYQVEGQAPGFPVVQNKLFRDNNSIGVWTLITTTAGTQTGFTDPDYGLYPNSRYRIEGDLGGLTCTPTMRTAAGVVSSRSNIKNKAIGITEIFDYDSKILLVPNPSSDFVFVKYSVAVENIKVLDYMGKEVMNEQTLNSKTGSSQLTIGRLTPGIYFVVCKGKDFEVRKKLVIE